MFTCVGLGYGQFTGRIALPIRSFFLEVSTLLTMTTVATINRLATMAGRYALLSRDPYSNQKTKGPIQRASTEMRKACRLVTLNETFEN